MLQKITHVFAAASKRITNIEDRLVTKLLDRNRQGVSLTPAGNSFGPTPFRPPPIFPRWKTRTAPCASLARTPAIRRLTSSSRKWISQTTEFAPCRVGSPIPQAFQYRFDSCLEPTQCPLPASGSPASDGSGPCVRPSLLSVRQPHETSLRIQFAPGQLH
jgi:hypothetical protein